MTDKITFECPSCRATLSLTADRTSCPVCEYLLSDDDRAAWQLLTEQDVRDGQQAENPAETA